jgi:hypothetical protein
MTAITALKVGIINKEIANNPNNYCSYLFLDDLFRGGVTR